jgi:hypothetical protein
MHTHFVRKCDEKKTQEEEKNTEQLLRVQRLLSFMSTFSFDVQIFCYSSITYCSLSKENVMFFSLQERERLFPCLFYLFIHGRKNTFYVYLFIYLFLFFSYLYLYLYQIFSSNIFFNINYSFFRYDINKFILFTIIMSFLWPIKENI